MIAWPPPRKYGSVYVASAALYVGMFASGPVPPRNGKTGPPPSGEYHIMLSRIGGRSVRPVLRGELFFGALQSYQPVRTVASVLLRSRYGCRLPMQYGQPWLPAEVMMVAVSYFAGPSSGSGEGASGPTQPAVSHWCTGSIARRAMFRTPIT
jgi:hypothetical protein